MVRLDNLREMLGYQSYIIEALVLFAVLFYIALQYKKICQYFDFPAHQYNIEI